MVIRVVKSKNSTKDTNHILSASDVLWFSPPCFKNRDLQKKEHSCFCAEKFGKSLSKGHNGSPKLHCTRGWRHWKFLWLLLVNLSVKHMCETHKAFLIWFIFNLRKSQRKSYGYPYNVVTGTAFLPSLLPFQTKRLGVCA